MMKFSGNWHLRLNATEPVQDEFIPQKQRILKLPRKDDHFIKVSRAKLSKWAFHKHLLVIWIPWPNCWPIHITHTNLYLSKGSSAFIFLLISSLISTDHLLLSSAVYILLFKCSSNTLWMITRAFPLKNKSSGSILYVFSLNNLSP